MNQETSRDDGGAVMGISVSSNDTIVRPPTSVDILHVPGLGRLQRWRRGRLAFQVSILTEYNRHKETL